MRTLTVKILECPVQVETDLDESEDIAKLVMDLIAGERKDVDKPEIT
jgi:hypothetical protein